MHYGREGDCREQGAGRYLTQLLEGRSARSKENDCPVGGGSSLGSSGVKT